MRSARGAAWAAAAWTTTVCGATPGEPVGPPTAAVATAACGPTDGPGVGIVLAASAEAARAARAPYVRVSLWGAPGELAGRTLVLTDGREGGAWRHASATEYEIATRGTAAVRRVAADTSIEGTVDLTFPSGARVRQSFRATWQPASPGPRCG